ncbi:MAG: hypothetical protein ACRCWY_10125, partial [Cellulosilyticaceae bacterium]
AFRDSVHLDDSLTDDINRWLEKLTGEEERGQYNAFKVAFRYSDFKTNDPSPQVERFIWGKDHIYRKTTEFDFPMGIIDTYYGGLRRELVDVAYEDLDPTKPLEIEGYIMDYRGDKRDHCQLIIGENPQSKDDAGNLIIDLTPYVN